MYQWFSFWIRVKTIFKIIFHFISILCYIRNQILQCTIFQFCCFNSSNVFSNDVWVHFKNFLNEIVICCTTSNINHILKFCHQYSVNVLSNSCGDSLNLPIMLDVLNHVWASKNFQKDKTYRKVIPLFTRDASFKLFPKAKSRIWKTTS